MSNPGTDSVITTDGQSRDLLLFNDRDGRSISATLKAYQCIYEHITGKPQKLSKQFSGIYCLKFGHLDQLNIKMEQILKTYNVAAKTLHITIFHEKNDREEFNSYESFSHYNISNEAPVIAVNFTYHFSIVYPQEKAIKDFITNIRLTPFVTDSDGDIAYRMMQYRFLNITSFIEVEYTDYVIARTVLETIAEWMKSFETRKENRVLLFFQKHSNELSSALQLIYIAISLLLAYINVDKIFPVETNDMNLLMRVTIKIIFYFGLGFLLISYLASKIEMAINALGYRAEIEINEGDKKLNRNNGNQNKIVRRSIVIYGILSIVYNLISAALASHILSN